MIHILVNHPEIGSLWIIRDYIDEVLPLLIKIVNLSLACGEKPEDLKLTIIKSFLKMLDGWSLTTVIWCLTLSTAAC